MGIGMGSSSPTRVMLLKREALRVGRSFRRLRVRSGRAWVTLDGRDVTLPRGGEVDLATKAGPAVVSPLGQMPVVIELLEGAAASESR